MNFAKKITLNEFNKFKKKKMMVVFNHNFVEEKKLLSETKNGSRLYTTPDGIKLKSVTTVLSEHEDKTWLYKWRKRVGKEEANRITVHSANRGKAVHKLAENYLLNKEDYIQKAMPLNIILFNQIKPILDEHVDNIYGIELPLYSKFLCTAGRTDLIAEYCKIPSIIDFKTSIRKKKKSEITNYFLQATTYSLMFEWMYKIKTPQIVLLVAIEEETKAQVFCEDRAKYVPKVLELFALHKKNS